MSDEKSSEEYVERAKEECEKYKERIELDYLPPYGEAEVSAEGTISTVIIAFAVTLFTLLSLGLLSF